MKKTRYLTAPEAAKRLGVSVTTLYAYVSRGLVHSEPAGEGRRIRRYLVEDVENLKQRKEQRRNPAKVVEEALHWGAPVLESALTLIADNRLYYRGYEVINLIETCTVEQVAVLLWTGALVTDEPALFQETAGDLSKRSQTIQTHLAGLEPIQAFQTLLAAAAADDLTAYDLRPAAVAQTGARILRLLTAMAVGHPVAGAGMAYTLQQGWSQDNPQATPLLNAALILCADHELNVSSFTARCVASAGATPYEVVIAGLSALQGVKHGRVTDRVEAFLREVGPPERAREAVIQRLKRGESIPGFGHPLYPEGDPRGRFLLERTAATYARNSAVARATAVIEAVVEVIGEQPTLDFGLVVLAQALNLPPGSPLALFALGRTIGWIGHAIEQYGTERMIRPRARYVGQPPRPVVKTQAGLLKPAPPVEKT